MKKVLIIGYGVVGKNMHKIFPHAEILDPVKGYDISDDSKFEVGFICVPTDKKPDGSADTSIVEEVVKKYSANIDVFCIKSTIPPGTTEILEFDLGSKIIFSPEYFGETIHANGADYNFLILGGDREKCKVVAEVYKEVSHSNLEMVYTNSRTAELCKYMENCWLAAKVTFCNEFARIAQACDVNYDELRELWLKDPRINRSHTFVFKNQPYYKSHCLDKDIPALIEFAKSVGYDPGLMKAVFFTNGKHQVDNID